MKKIKQIQQENKALRIKIKQDVKVKDELMMEIKKNRHRMDSINDMEKKIEKYEFVLDIDKYKKVS